MFDSIRSDHGDESYSVWSDIVNDTRNGQISHDYVIPLTADNVRRFASRLDDGVSGSTRDDTDRIEHTIAEVFSQEINESTTILSTKQLRNLSICRLFRFCISERFTADRLMNGPVEDACSNLRKLVAIRDLTILSQKYSEKNRYRNEDIEDDFEQLKYSYRVIDEILQE